MAARAVPLAVIRAETLEPRVLLAVFTVTTTADSGGGSLRQAMLDANTLAGPDEIRFNIPGPGVRTITPLSPLPAVTDAVNLDATTQPGYAGTPVIELNGSQARDPRAPGGLARGLLVQAGPSLLRGLAVNRFGGDGVVLAEGATGSRVEACFIGTNAAGTEAAGNGGAGVRVQADAAVVGGGGPERRNVISGNNVGVLFDRTSAGTGVVSGNFVGTDATGANTLGNRTYGVDLAGLATVRVGGPNVAERNVVSGNGASGILVTASASPPPRSRIVGNYVGTDAQGTRAIPNGTSAAVTYPVPTYHDGITVRVGSTPVTGNLVSGNRGNGITLWGRTGPVAGNYVGTDATGSRALGNGGNGIEVVAGSTLDIGAAGPDDVPAVIDPAGAGRNVISGNGGHGILTAGGDGGISYNYIGVSADGTLPLGNRGSGIHSTGAYLVIGGTRAGEGNVISANGGDGVTSVDGGNILGNRIGTNAAGDDATPGLGNTGNGVQLQGAASVTVNYFVRTRAVRNNTIAFNGANGVLVQGSAETGARATISRNSIFSNGRLGIDLAAPSQGVSDVHPVILRAVSDGQATAVRFRGMGTVEFFASPEPDPSGFGEGKVFLGAPICDGTEQTVRLPPVAPGMFITATSTVGTRVSFGVRPDTSEFSNAVAVVPGVVEPSASVAGRYVFYNWSAFDSSQPGFAEYPPNDDPAIDPTKRALLPGQTASFANVTSFTKGLNGIMFDMKDMPLGTQLPNIEVKMSEGGARPGELLTWVPAPRPTLIDRRTGAGVGGTDRITLIWPNGAIRNRWLQVTVKADDVSWLPRDDVFYFGNLVGEVGDAASPLRVSAVDLAAVRRMNAIFPGPVGLRDVTDIDRNGSLAGDGDVAAVRANLGHSLPPLVAPPAPATTLAALLLRRKGAREELLGSPVTVGG